MLIRSRSLPPFGIPEKRLRPCAMCIVPITRIAARHNAPTHTAYQGLHSFISLLR
ncbi:hypothetical protein CY34DRAFT_801219 [Suillus luteus UH-Slu-Lm8-n1]|uniref:Uncharacterized protein n=1 Tax=Suillus luteus UH-Slu-Lm8-n1 TaxID=930992 RepID=A0A0D0BI86_9AGAM|nr:hypothetical protein CY34DRAFT_801219 [Suillus luteus UH-Slu-Lm8-n1]